MAFIDRDLYDRDMMIYRDLIDWDLCFYGLGFVAFPDRLL